MVHLTFEQCKVELSSLAFSKLMADWKEIAQRKSVEDTRREASTLKTQPGLKSLWESNLPRIDSSKADF